MRGWLAAAGGALAAMWSVGVHRAAEWERFEAELIAVTGSRADALTMAECAIVAAKSGVGSPEELEGIIRRAVLAGNDLARVRRRLLGVVSDIEDMEGL